jgi:hypothetical protein
MGKILFLIVYFLRFPLGSLVWAKISGYPWWPSIVCEDPSARKAYRWK